MNNRNRNILFNLLIILAGALLFIPGIGAARLFDLNETVVAESAREMLVTGDWLNVRINFESIWDKPPLFIWMQALSMKIFGVGEFAARFPNAIMGILTLLVLFNIGRRMEDERFGLVWAGMYLISFLPFFYFKSGIVEPCFNFFVFLGIYCFSRYAEPGMRTHRIYFASLSAAFIGLAILAKGPLALLIFCLSLMVWIFHRKFHFSFRWVDVLAFIFVLALVGGSRIIAFALTGHTDSIDDFIRCQINMYESKAIWGGFHPCHFIVILMGAVPASVLALPTFGKRALEGERNDTLAHLFRWMMIAFWVGLILSTLQSPKNIHHSSFCFFPLTFLAAYSVTRTADCRMRFSGWQCAMLIICAICYGLALIVPCTFYNANQRIVSCLMSGTEWAGFVPVVGIVLIVTTIWFCVSFKIMREIRSIFILVCGSILFLMTTTVYPLGETEKDGQDSAINFYIERQGEDCYVQPAYFKSYAHYFYTDRQPQNTCEDFEWLSRGPIDKVCYFVVKDRLEDIRQLRLDVPDIKFLYKSSGFRFFVRKQPGTYQDASKEQDDNQ